MHEHHHIDQTPLSPSQSLPPEKELKRVERQNAQLQQMKLNSEKNDFCNKNGPISWPADISSKMTGRLIDLGSIGTNRCVEMTSLSADKKILSGSVYNNSGEKRATMWSVDNNW